jgi:DNA-3-methyladenine glycosylase II
LRPLTQKSLALAARELAARDEMLAGIHAITAILRSGAAHRISTLAHIILEQQVSLKSAKRCSCVSKARFSRSHRSGFLSLATVSAQARSDAAEVAYLSASFGFDRHGRLSFTKLARMSDEDARVVLTRIKGIGSWSADVYLLMAMRARISGRR